MSEQFAELPTAPRDAAARSGVVSPERAPAAGRPPQRLVILTGDIDGNLGDRAILGGTLDGLRALDPTVEATVLSAEPDRLAAELQVSALRRRPRSLPALLAAAARADAVLIGGGGLFQDDDSLVKMPFWAALVTVLRLVQPRLIGHALGVGPLRSRSGRVTGAIALRLLRQVTVRDAEALHVAASLVAGQITVVPDPALLLEPAPVRQAVEQLGPKPTSGPRIGVALRRFVPARARLVPRRFTQSRGIAAPADEAVNERWVAMLAVAFDRFLDAYSGEIVFIPSYDQPHEGDVMIAEAVRRRMRHPATRILRLDEPRLYKAVCGQLDLVVGGRMHPTILAAGLRRPVCGLSYNPKFEGFFAALDRADLVRPVADLVEQADGAAIFELMAAALARGPVAAERLAALQARIRAHLALLLDAS